MEILIITGMSGAGKSKAASYLEDAGYYIVDNLPAEMMLKFANFCVAANGRYDRVALVYDVRAGEDFHALLDVVARMKTMECNCRVLFLECDTEVLIQRYKETRRMHPLWEEGRSLQDTVLREQELLKPVRSIADCILNTSTYSTGKLRGEILQRFGGGTAAESLVVNVVSFGYKYGIPLEADLLFDVRFMPNPFYIEELRSQTGLQAGVRDYVLSFGQTQEFLERLKGMLKFLLPLYSEEGKTVLVIGIGCTGGRHRSVAITHELAEYIKRLGFRAAENHRDMTRT